MTEEERKAIDACKDQAAKKWKYTNFNRAVISASQAEILAIVDEALQLYGEKCREDALRDSELILEAIDTALSVGEIHFETCVLSAGAKKRLLEAKKKLTPAPAVPHAKS